MHAQSLALDTPKSGVYYLKGSDIYWLKYAEDIFAAILPKDSLSVSVFDKLSDISQAISALFTLSFESEFNIIIIKDTDFKLDNQGKKALKYILDVGVAPNFLVFSNVNFLSNADKKKMTEINCDRLDKFATANYIKDMFVSGIDRRALDLLITYTNCDMARIMIEKEKLLAFCGDKAVTADDVANIVVEDTDLFIYQFVNNIVAGKKLEATAQMERLLKRGESHSYLLAALLNQFRRMLHSAISGLDNKTLAGIFNVKEYAILKAREQNKYTKMKLKNIVDMLVDYEYKFKSGEISEQTALSCVVSKLLMD